MSRSRKTRLCAFRAIEIISVCTLIMTHLSRLAEELVQWSAAEFDMARIGGAWTTGSSAMPQKRNPDVAELVRGKTGRVLGDLTAIHMMLNMMAEAFLPVLHRMQGGTESYRVPEAADSGVSEGASSGV